MSADETALTVEILGDASSGVAAAGASQAANDALTAAIVKLTASMDAATASGDLATAGITRVGEASARTTGLADALTEHSLLLSRGFQALGVDAGEAGARVGALGDIMGRFAAVNPTMLAAVTTLTAAFAGFEVFKDAVQDASRLQESLILLGNAVKNQGGDWTHLQSQVKNFADTQERMTTFSNTEVIQALNKLVETGTSLSDAFVIVRVAEDAAAATGHNLIDITNALMEAEHGRTRVLAELGIGTRQSIHDGMSLDQILSEIEAHMGGAAIAATTSYSGSVKQLSDAWEHLMQDVGMSLLPMLTDAAKGLRDTVEAADNASGSFEGLVPEIEDTGQNLHAVADQVGSILIPSLIGLDNILGGDATNAWGVFGDAARSTLGTIDAVVKGIREANQAVTDMENAAKAAGDWVNNQVSRIPFVGHWIAGVDEGISSQIDADPGSGASNADMGAASAGGWGASRVSTHTKQNPNVGGHSTSGGAPYSFSPEQITAQYATPEIKDQTDALRGLDEELAKLPKTVEGYTQALALLSPQISETSKQENALAIAADRAEQNYGQTVNSYNSGVTALRNAQTEYDAYGKSLDGTTKLTTEQREELQKLKQAVEEARQHLEDLKTSMDGAKSTYDQLSTQQAKAAQQLDQLQKLYDANSTAIQKLVTDLADYVQKSTETYQLDYLTFRMTNQQKYEFYKAIYDNMRVVDEDSLREKEDVYNKMMEAWYGTLQQQYKQYTDYTTQIQKLTDQFINDFLQKHQSMEQSLKKIYEQMLHDFEEMIAQMLSKLIASGLMNFITSLLGGGGMNALNSQVNQIGDWFFKTGGGTGNAYSQTNGGPLGPSAVGAAISGASSYGILGALLGSEGASQVIGALANSGGVTGHPGAAGGGGNMNLTVSPSSVAGAAGGSQAATAASSGSGSAASTLGGAGGSSAGARSLSSLFTGGNAIANALGLGGGGTSSPGSAWTGTFDSSSDVGGITGATQTAAGAGTMLPGGLKIGGVALGSLLAGALGGELLSHMVFGNNQYSEIGGAVGGAGGTLLGSLLGHLLFTGGAAAGPVGMILGAVLGSLAGGALGSLFGNHFSQADEPDVYQTQQWGQELADMQGSTPGDPMVANGQNFTMDSWTRSNTMGLGWNRLFEQFIAKFRSNPKVLPQELQAGFQNLEELWGGATNQGDFNDNGKNGILSIGSGRAAEWSTFWGYVGAYGPAIASLMQMYEPQDLYSASLRGSVSEVGGFSPNGTPWLLHQFPDVGIAPGGSGGPGADAAPAMNFIPGASKQTVTNVNVYASFGGSMIAQTAFVKSIRDAVASVPGFSQADLSG